MVHALELIHNLLDKTGTLIDIRPRGLPPEVMLQQGSSSTLIGHYQETDDFIEYRQAAWAMEQAIDQDLFRLRTSGTFEFINHAESFAELKAFMQQEWSDSLLPPELELNAARLGPGKVTLHEAVHLGVLDRLP